MTLYWKFLAKAYLKVFILSTFGFISILLITRLRDIARFAAVTYNVKNVMLYTLFQIPHILPMAIPISCLISSFLLFQKFSRTAELTALRACGLPIKKIIFPIIFVSIFISFLNFFITSELTPNSRIYSKKLAHMEITLNPIMLLERQQLLKIKNSYIDLKSSGDKNIARDLIFISSNKATDRLNMIIAKEIALKEDNLIGKNLSIISFFQGVGFDTLMLENQEKMITQASNLSKYMNSTTFSLNPVHLPTKMLLVRDKVYQNDSETSPISEVIRRCALSFSAFSFTFIGICFGTEIGRLRSKKKIFYAALSALLILLSFTIGKGLKYHPILANLCFILPQPIILLLSTYALFRISRGLE